MFRKTYNRLNSMIDDAIKGTFEESKYDETELSKLEVKWKRFLNNSKLSKQAMEKERENIKGIVSDISHQTKTPLSNIMLYTQLLQERSIDEDTKGLVNQISYHAEKLEFLIQAMVKTSRLESGTMSIVPIKQKIDIMLEAAIKEIEPKASKKNIAIELKGDRDMEACYDVKWTEEAIYNILDNAVKYSKENTKITVELIKFELYMCIKINDQGMGIKEEELNQIFKRFYRSTIVQQEDGIGIGLYLAREIIRQQQGYIKATSEICKGSTFEVYLPV